MSQTGLSGTSAAAACWALCRPLRTHDTTWVPAPNNPKVTLNVVLDGCIVPTESGAARVDYSHLVLLDNFIDERTRQQLLDCLTEPGWTGSAPPSSKWEQATCDGAGRLPTWGLSHTALHHFAASDVPAKLEVQSRLCKLYPDMIIAHMPSDQIQIGLSAGHAQPQKHASEADQPLQQQESQQLASDRLHQQQEGQPSQPADQRIVQQPAVDCSYFLANAAVCGDVFSWHVDADPEENPTPSPWTDCYGTYCNREPGKPLFVSLLLYLDANWPLDHDAETLFLDSMTDTGVFVRPKQYRAVLLDQDIVHRLSTPSAAAGRPRYSLVWKLVMFPKQLGGSCSIAKPEWGRPTYFGSAAHVERAVKEVASTAAASRKRPAVEI